jgi:hypothetical protein
MWEMYAHKSERGSYLNCGEKWWVEIHDLSLPIVKVRITENPEGKYYGWIDTGETTPEMIQPHEWMFSMQFAYGPEIEVEKGKGRIVRLDVVECPEVGEPS